MDHRIEKYADRADGGADGEEHHDPQGRDQRPSLTFAAAHHELQSERMSLMPRSRIASPGKFRTDATTVMVALSNVFLSVVCGGWNSAQSVLCSRCSFEVV